MARTKQTARASVGGKAPRKNASSQAARKNPMTPEEQKATKIAYDISYESSFYAHYFHVNNQECNKPFEASFAVGKTTNPFNAEETEYWMAVNFNSQLDGQGIQQHGRPILNLSLVVDISGSMGSSFLDDESRCSKLEVAKKALKSIVDQLHDEDRLALVIFDHRAEVLQPMIKKKDLDPTSLEKTINGLQTRGGTELTNALKCATELYSHIEEDSKSSHRIFFLTDMEQNSKEDGKNFVSLVQSNASQNIFTTVVGVGMDLHSSIINQVSSTPGANYSNVRSSNGFEELMKEEFPYLVTPLGFNISLELKSEHFHLVKGFGSPEVANAKPDTPIRISTEFPSPQNAEGARRGGLLLFRLELKNKNSDSSLPFQVEVQHEDLQGLIHSHTQQLSFGTEQVSPSLRKAILLVRFTDLMQEFVAFRQKRQSDSSLSHVSYRKKLMDFIKLFESEKKEVQDESLNQEIDLLYNFVEFEPEEEQEPKESKEGKSDKVEKDEDEGEEDEEDDYEEEVQVKKKKRSSPVKRSSTRKRTKK